METSDKVKLIYVIPNFQNPTGRTWSLERRKELSQIANRYQIVVIEDDPYGELRYEGETLPSVKSFDDNGCVFCLGTFSKIFCPGYRIGWIAGDKNAIEKYVIVKQGADLQCNTTAQMEISKYIELYDIDRHIDKIRNIYKQRRDITVQTMESEFPREVTFTKPKGGLFAWVELPSYMNAYDVLKKCLEHNVAFVPGASFYPNVIKWNTFRINFSNMPEDRIVEGLKCLGKILYDFIEYPLDNKILR